MQEYLICSVSVCSFLKNILAPNRPISHLRASHLFLSPSPIIPRSEIFVHGDLQWDIFQVIISRSTTPDLIKIGMKLQEFFTQQFDTSKRALSTWGPGPYPPPKTPVINAEKGAAELCKQTLSLALLLAEMFGADCGAEIVSRRPRRLEGNFFF